MRGEYDWEQHSRVTPVELKILLEARMPWTMTRLEDDLLVFTFGVYFWCKTVSKKKKKKYDFCNNQALIKLKTVLLSKWILPDQCHRGSNYIK